MKTNLYIMLLLSALSVCCFSCDMEEKTAHTNPTKVQKQMSAKDILGNAAYRAISYGGYRDADHDVEPTLEELKEDMKILSAAGIKILRTYKVHFPHASNVLKAIRQLKEEDPSFEMYVMLGAWIDCKNAWTDKAPEHNAESPRNATEIETAVALAKQYPDIVKVIAVGNEAMVKWAAAYYVEPWVILKWVNHLQALKKTGELPADLWITSSDNFASWGGGGAEYHTPDLNKLIEAVDYISLHTYPMHDTHYNPQFWGLLEEEENKTKDKQIEAAMQRALDYAKAQYDSTANYIKSLNLEKPIHIGETGWATASNGFYGDSGSKATDEYKSGLYHNLMRAWTDKAGISCFYFEAFDEPWKDAANPGGSENHFGLITVDGKAKYPLWEAVNSGVFKNLSRGGHPITKTYNGQKDALLQAVKTPPVNKSVTMQKSE